LLRLPSPSRHRCHPFGAVALSLALLSLSVVVVTAVVVVVVIVVVGVGGWCRRHFHPCRGPARAGWWEKKQKDIKHEAW